MAENSNEKLCYTEHSPNLTFSFIAQTHSRTDGKKCRHHQSATGAIFILKFKTTTTTTYCSAERSRSVTEKKCSHHDYLFISK